MRVNKLDRAFDDLARAIIIVIDVKPMVTRRMSHKIDREVSRRGKLHEPVNAGVHLMIVQTGSRDEDWRNLLFSLAEKEQRRELSERFIRYSRRRRVPLTLQIKFCVQRNETPKIRWVIQ